MDAKVYRYKAILKYGLLAMCTVIAVFLAYYNTGYSIRLMDIPFSVIRWETHDSLILHFITMGIFLIVVLVVQRTQHIHKEKVFTFLLSAVMLYAAICCFAWVISGDFWAQNDSRYVLECMERMRNGDYSDLQPSGYLGKYKQHFGLITLFRFLFWISGTTNDIVIQFFNCLCVPVIIFVGTRILKELNAAESALVIYLIFMAFCFPLFLYTPYVYGEIISATAGLLFIWAAIRFLKKGKAGSWAVLTVSAVIGNMARGNFPVLLIAFAIMAFLYSVRRKRIQFIVCAVSLFLAIGVADKLNIAYYESVSGIVLDQGIPLEAWVAMGMNEWGDLGYGTYNGYAPEIYAKNGYDTEKTREDARHFISDRVKMFLSGAGMSAKDFYKGKLLLQWNDPTLNCFMENRSFHSQPCRFVSDIVLEDGKYAAQAKTLMNQYQFLFYTGFLLYCVSLWKENNPFYQYFPLVILVGGGFYLPWFGKQCPDMFSPM
ncbi:MAG: glycosyltransferase family 39 protein [Lachnospiraceae bacterium]|nr:glycosyltransferase family 39 protein [Lachnospiraceae bacterium]